MTCPLFFCICEDGFCVFQVSREAVIVLEEYVRVGVGDPDIFFFGAGVFEYVIYLNDAVLGQLVSFVNFGQHLARPADVTGSWAELVETVGRTSSLGICIVIVR